MFSRFVICLISGFHIIGCSGLGAAERPPIPNQNASSSPRSSSIPIQSTPPLSCAPVVPHPEWTSPYAGYSRGVPTDPSFFPIAVWLQGTWHAPKWLAQIGDQCLRRQQRGGQCEYAHGRRSADAPDIRNLCDCGPRFGGSCQHQQSRHHWMVMSPDEPDNAQSSGRGGYGGPPVDPSTIMAEYKSMKAADSTRPA
jgi:hypothetical protein